MARKYRHFVYDKKQRFIYPTSDWGFKFLFGTETNKELLIGLLHELLPEMDIVSLEYIPRDITIPVGKMKDTSFDVLCKLRDGSIVIIEMQNYVRGSFLDRSLIYTSAAILEHYVNSTMSNYKLNKTIFLSFLGDPLFKNVNRTPIRLSLCDIDEATTTVRNDKILQIFVELPKFGGDLTQINEKTPFVEKLAYVLMEMADCNDIPNNLDDSLLENLFQIGDTFNMRPDIKDDYMKAVLGETEYQYRIESAVEEAVEEAVAEAVEEAVEQANAEHEAKVVEIRKANEAEIVEIKKANEARIDAIKEKLFKIGLSAEVIDTVLGNSESE